jgi:poly(A) polymerase
MHPLFDGLDPLLTALNPHGKAGLVRVVGGAVRAWLRHENLAYVDTDLATALPPEDVLSACLKARLVAEAPGLRWGTVVVQVAGKKIEITSLREDTYSPGSRYPTVRWVADWEKDATRRDFTCNAVYVAEDGTLFDPFGGVQDLQHSLVRFVGDAATRVREDPLRIIRFFRFCGHYGLGGLTPELAGILRAAAPGLSTVSEARRVKEMTLLRATPQATSVLHEMERLGLA